MREWMTLSRYPLRHEFARPLLEFGSSARMGTDMTEIPERLADYRRDPHYERRVVVFYDVDRSVADTHGSNPRLEGMSVGTVIVAHQVGRR